MQCKFYILRTMSFAICAFLILSISFSLFIGNLEAQQKIDNEKVQSGKDKSHHSEIDESSQQVAEMKEKVQSGKDKGHHSEIDELSQQVAEMKENINLAIEKLNKVGSDGSEEARLKGVEDFIGPLNSAKKNMSDNGTLVTILQKSIDKFKIAKSEADKRSSDQKIGAEFRKLYKEAAKDLIKKIDNLVEQQILIKDLHSKLDEKIKKINDHKDYISFKILINDTRDANIQLTDVIKSCKSMGESLSTFMGKMEKLTGQRDATKQDHS